MLQYRIYSVAWWCYRRLGGEFQEMSRFFDVSYSGPGGHEGLWLQQWAVHWESSLSSKGQNLQVQRHLCLAFVTAICFTWSNLICISGPKVFWALKLFWSFWSSLYVNLCLRLRYTNYNIFSNNMYINYYIIYMYYICCKFKLVFTLCPVAQPCSAQGLKTFTQAWAFAWVRGSWNVSWHRNLPDVARTEKAVVALGSKPTTKAGE